MLVDLKFFSTCLIKQETLCTQLCRYLSSDYLDTYGILFTNTVKVYKSDPKAKDVQ